MMVSPVDGGCVSYPHTCAYQQQARGSGFRGTFHPQRSVQVNKSVLDLV
jgi:hypothetical protein